MRVSWGSPRMGREYIFHAIVLVASIRARWPIIVDRSDRLLRDKLGSGRRGGSGRELGRRRCRGVWSCWWRGGRRLLVLDTQHRQHANWARKTRRARERDNGGEGGGGKKETDEGGRYGCVARKGPEQRHGAVSPNCADRSPRLRKGRVLEREIHREREGPWSG